MILYIAVALRHKEINKKANKNRLKKAVSLLKPVF